MNHGYPLFKRLKKFFHSAEEIATSASDGTRDACADCHALRARNDNLSLFYLETTLKQSASLKIPESIDTCYEYVAYS